MLLWWLTDTYGDVPYFEAGKGFIDGTVFPSYDPQQAIYMDLLNEISEASAALNESADDVAQDALYGGNINQWKKFGYSLLLRAAMRLSKVDPATAQQYVTTSREWWPDGIKPGQCGSTTQCRFQKWRWYQREWRSGALLLSG